MRLGLHALVGLVLACCLSSALAETAATRSVRVAPHHGRPTIFVDGSPLPMASYCPIGWSRPHFVKHMTRFYPHRMNFYQIMLPGLNQDLMGTRLWVGDQVSNAPLFDDLPKMQGFNDISDSANDILANDPGACIVVRYFIAEPASWRKLHPEEYFVTETGVQGPNPSLASDLYWDTACRFATAVIQHCEAFPWASRLIGYTNFTHTEGCLISAIEGWTFDHNPLMVRRFREFLRARYGTEAALQAAWRDPALTFDTVTVPTDKLRGPTPVVSNLLYWQAPADNQPLRDYLELTQQLFHQRTRQIYAAMRAGTDRSRFFLYDMFKQPMQGWNCGDFFYNKDSRRLADPDMMSASGSMGVTALFDGPAFDGLITPHDYQARGPGGVFEPEGMADSTVLRGKVFLAEMDLRTYVDKPPSYGQARDLREYEAISWRNIATALTRGFYVYWMDLSSDWYAPDEIQRVISRQVEVIKASLNWTHQTVPGVAMILDDRSVLETNGAGNYLNDAVMWEQKMGLARCGVPYRIYMLEDLALPDFPPHRVFYFPNLFRLDDERLALLRDKVLRDGNVVVWGPGSGISDGQTVGPDSASRLTGFTFRYWPVNFPRRTLLSNFEHPLTRGLAADTVIGSPLSYGPLLFPLDGTALGLAWTKNGETIPGLAVKTFGKGARTDYRGRSRLGRGDYASVFTSAVPLPADLWRNLARYAGAHVYSDTNDVTLADAEIVAVHSLAGGDKVLHLPDRYDVTDVITGQPFARNTDTIRFRLQGPDTRVFRLQPPGGR